MKTISISFEVFRVVINLISKMSYSEISKLLGREDSDKLHKWYFDNRSRESE